METYKQLKERQEAEVKSFIKEYCFFAFSNDQFEEGMKNLNLDPAADGNKIARIPGGGFVLKEHLKEFNAMIDKHENETRAGIKADPDGKGFLYQLLTATMFNHEYGLTQDDEEALSHTPLAAEDLADPVIYDTYKRAAEYVIENTY